ncbi:MAG: DUF2627 domain-containing protein [Candidatus Symbiopectobacterium sp. Dall1.0]|nr:DUF2627 domain-containing protein [Candidatus Symbiopectobacterium sp. Dall1.0]
MWVKRGTVLYMSGIFSKEVEVNDTTVSVAHYFSADPYLGASKQ